jgi:hypothetical protein
MVVAVPSLSGKIQRHFCATGAGLALPHLFPVLTNCIESEKKWRGPYRLQSRLSDWQ